jgi:hypothetical protein
MKIEKYQIQAGEKLKVFEFVSVGIKGKITKIVQFTPTNYKDLYNLGFGDKKGENDLIDDTIVSNNGDSEKVLATVVSILFVFLENNKKAMVYVSGSSESRTRLYRMGISKYFSEVKDNFDIFGELESGWEYFNTNKDYEAFIIRKKRK